MRLSLSERSWRQLLALLGLALAYASVSVLTLRHGPDYAVTLFPPAGIALGMVLVYGAGVLPGVALGSLAAHVILAGGWSAAATQGLAVPLGLALAKTAHAAVGAWLLKRSGQSVPRLDDAPAIGRFSALAVLGCMVGATLAIGLLLALGRLQRADLLTAWANWWLGDAVGVLIFAPLVLALLAAPRSLWRPRLTSFALPMVLLTALALVAIVQITRWDNARVQQELTREADRIISVLDRGLEQPAVALHIAALNLARSDVVEVIALDEAVRLWGAVPAHVLSSGWAPLRGDPPTLRAKSEVAHSSPPQLTDDVDLYRLAGAHARLSDAAQQVNGIALLGPLADGRIVLAQPVLGGSPARGTGDRWQRATGVLFVAISSAVLLADATANAEPGLMVCLFEAVGPYASVPRPLAGPAACVAPEARAPIQRENVIEVSDSRWLARVVAAPTYIYSHRSWTALALTQTSLLAVYVIGMFLLAVTSRALRDTARAERSEALLEDMFEVAPFGMVVVDPQGHYLRVNEAFSQITGYAPQELLKMRFQDITHPEDQAADMQRTNAIFAGKTLRGEREKRYLRRDGSIVHVRIQNAIKRDAQGQVTAVLAVVEDVTERLRLAELEQAKRRAEAANRAKTDFLSRMSHELRTPLNAMLGFTQLLARDRPHNLHPLQRERISLVERSGWHLLAMIEDVLDLSHIESGTVRLSMEPVALEPLLRDTMRLLAHEAERAQVAVDDPDLGPDAQAALADATRLRQVLSNLLSNAVKYNHAGGHVRLSARRLGDGRVAVAVRDTGMGLSDSQISRLYEPFNRLGRETSGKPGTGIGLSITRRLVELMEGELQVRSEPGRGSTFTVLLRAADAPLPGRASAQAAPPRSDYVQARVIYIEDNEVNAELMAAVLAHRPQLALRVCATAAQGMAALREEPCPDLVLLDMHLPDGDGLTLLEKIRREPRCSQVPVIMVSADALSEQVQAALRAGAVAYITKPLQVEEALREIDRVLARRAHAFSA